MHDSILWSLSHTPIIIMAITSRDIVAAEAHYHTSCYKNYTRVIKKASKDDDERVSENDILIK